MQHRQTAFDRAHFLLELHKEEGLQFAAYGEYGPLSAFLDFPEIKDYAKALPGVKEETILKLAFNPARVKIDGRHIVAIPFHDAAYGWNIVGWDPLSPEGYYLWRQDGNYMLGRDNIEGRLIQGTMPRIHDTPLEWLQHDMQGVVIL